VEFTRSQRHELGHIDLSSGRTARFQEDGVLNLRRYRRPRGTRPSRPVHSSGAPATARPAAVNAGALLLALQLGGCYLGHSPVTYPSPAPLNGDEIIYPSAEPNKLSQSARANRYGFESLCHQYGVPVGSAPTRNAVAFASEGVRYCFFSPEVAQRKYASVFCAAAAFDHLPDEAKGYLIFRVRVGGTGVVLSDPQATLVVHSQTLHASGVVKTSSYVGYESEAPLGAEPIFHTGTVPMYSVAGFEISYQFEYMCDPMSSYELTITGIRSSGHPVEVPAVRFEPTKEWRPVLLD